MATCLNITSILLTILAFLSAVFAEGFPGWLKKSGSWGGLWIECDDDFESCTSHKIVWDENASKY